MTSKINFDPLKFYVQKDEQEKVEKISESLHVADVANELKTWNINEVISFIKMLNPEKGATLLISLDSKTRNGIFKGIDAKNLKIVLNCLDADEAVKILNAFDDETLNAKFLKNISLKLKKEINTIYRYDSSNTGFHMAVNYISININDTVASSRKKIQMQLRQEREISSTLPIVDNENYLIGIISLNDFLLEKSNVKISDLQYEEINAPRTTSSISETALLLSKYNIDVIPVLNSRDILIGVVQASEIVKMLQTISVSLGTSIPLPTEKTYRTYKQISAFKEVVSRSPWIISLLFLGIITQVIIALFQNVWTGIGAWESSGTSLILSNIIFFAFSMGMSISSSINDSGGNVGAQSSTVVIESIAKGEITTKDMSYVLKKETLSGLYMGLVVGVLSIGRTWLVWGMLGTLNGVTSQVYYWLFIISLIAALSFFVTVIFGNFTGSLLPMIGMKHNWKSSIMSGPVQTTLVDIFTFAFYLGVTTAIFVPLAHSGQLSTI